MINLTRVTSTNISISRTDQEGPIIQKDYLLKDIWVNPKYIFLLEEDPTLVAEHKTKPLKQDLDGRIGFTKVHIADKGYARQVSVVGHPNLIINKIRENNE